MANSTLEKINKLDINILRFINRKISNKTLNILLPPLTNKYKFHYLAEILGLYLYSRIMKKPEIFKNILLIFSEAFAATVLIKFIIRRQRPFVNHKDIIDRDSGSPNVGAEEFKIDNEIIKFNRTSWYAFPSTEAATSVILFKTLLKANNPLHNLFLTSYFSLILFSRMYNGVHRPADIISGSILGWYWPNKKINLEK